jgi:NADH dehydrogenase [ubiquinone] 1 alpha subcomplex assembly factor 7
VTPLENHIVGLIRQGGPIPLDAFMDIALGHPEYGYYRTRDPLGRRGDFITAPEISQMFGELIGLWCVDMWQKLGSPSSFNLIELGPGRGTLMADALRAAKLVPAFRTAAKVTFVETSPTLRAEQKKRVPDASWIEQSGDLLPGPSLIIANEFFDALPIRQFQQTDSGWKERCVTLPAQSKNATPNFEFCLSDETCDPALLSSKVRGAPEGSIAEICPLGQQIAGDLAGHLDAAPGAALIIDYGYTHSAPGDTFQALKGHAYVSPLADPGEADLTAHVDFAALARAASGATSHGPVDQGAFLKALGIEARAGILMANAKPHQRQEIEAAHHRLTDPTAMGSLFKVMALTSRGIPVPAGF